MVMHHDGITIIAMLRLCPDEISIPLSLIFNKALSSGHFPDNWKMANVQPVHKKNSRQMKSNYRPISLLPLISQLIEKIIYEQTKKYLSDHNILYKYQSGFRTNHSTDTCLSYLNDKILKGFDQGNITGMILIDLQKAFNTIDHKVLIDKLVYIG